MTQRAFWQERVRQAVEARETPQQKKPRQAETKVTRTPYYAQNNGEQHAVRNHRVQRSDLGS
jgi:hypothetical protein